MNFLKRNRLYFAVFSFFIFINPFTYAVEMKKANVITASDVKQERMKLVQENETKVLQTGFDWLFEETDEAGKKFQPYYNLDFDLSLGTNLGLKFGEKESSYSLVATPFAGLTFEIYPTTYLKFAFDLGISLGFSKDFTKDGKDIEYTNTANSSDKMIFETLKSTISSSSLYMEALLVDVYMNKPGFMSNYTLTTSLGFIHTPVFFSLPNDSATSQYKNRVGSLIGQDNGQIIGGELVNKYMKVTENTSTFYTELSITAGKSSGGVRNGLLKSDMIAGFKFTYDYTKSTDEGFDYEFDPYSGKEAFSTSLVIGAQYSSKPVINDTNFVHQYLEFGIQYGIQYSIFSMIATYTNGVPASCAKKGKANYGSFYELEGAVHIIPKLLISSLRVGFKKPVKPIKEGEEKPSYAPSKENPWDMIAGLSFGLYPLKNKDIKVVLEAAYIRPVPFDLPDNNIDLGLYVAFSF